MKDKFGNWLNKHALLIGFAIIVGGWLGVANLMVTPERREIKDCISKLNDAADGGLSYFKLEEMCLLLQQEGKLP